MSILRVASLFALALVMLCGRAGGAEPELDVGAILARLEQAARGCQSIDVEFTRNEYDESGRCEHTARGRLYWEATHIGCCKIENDWLIWDDGGSRCIDTNAKKSCTYPAALISLARLKLDEFESKLESDGFFAGLQTFVLWTVNAFGPPDELLLTTQFRAADLLDQFQISSELQGNNILLTAIPRMRARARWYREIAMLIDPQSFQILGCLTRHKPGTRTTTWIFNQVRINETPADRIELLWPQLTGFETWRADSSKELREGR